MVLSSMQLQKVSVTLWFRRLQCLVLRSVLSVFSNLRSAECVCSYYGLRVCYKQINKKKINLARLRIFKWKTLKFVVALVNIWFVSDVLNYGLCALCTSYVSGFDKLQEYIWLSLEKANWMSGKLCKGKIFDKQFWQ